VEKIHHTWSYASDATVLDVDDYALTTTAVHTLIGNGTGPVALLCTLRR